MRATAIVVLAFLLLGLAMPASAQKRQKDPMLEQYLISEFAQLNAKLDRMQERVVALESELARVKQNQAEMITEIRSTQTTVKTMDTSLSTFRLSNQQDLFSLKTDLTQVRQDMARLMDLIMKGGSAAPAPAPAPTPAPAAPSDSSADGYITAVSEDGKEVTISLGSSAGIKVGSELNVFKAGDTKKEVGIIEVVEVVDANNSRAKVVFVRPSFRFEFSDIVRPR